MCLIKGGSPQHLTKAPALQQGRWCGELLSAAMLCDMAGSLARPSGTSVTPDATALRHGCHCSGCRLALNSHHRSPGLTACHTSGCCHACRSPPRHQWTAAGAAQCEGSITPPKQQCHVVTDASLRQPQADGTQDMAACRKPHITLFQPTDFSKQCPLLALHVRWSLAACCRSASLAEPAHCSQP